MLSSFGYVGILLIVATLFPLVTLTFASLVRPKKPNPIKQLTYECGLEAEGGAWVQFNIRYYLYAIIFVVFDIETVFLYPWAVAFRKLELFGFVEMAVFIAILVVGLVYAWKKKALEWS